MGDILNRIILQVVKMTPYFTTTAAQRRGAFQSETTSIYTSYDDDGCYNVVAYFHTWHLS